MSPLLRMRSVDSKEKTEENSLGEPLDTDNAALSEMASKLEALTDSMHKKIEKVKESSE